MAYWRSSYFSLPPGERHEFGSLMQETVMSTACVYIMNVGTDMPLNSLRLAAKDYKADVVVLADEIITALGELVGAGQLRRSRAPPVKKPPGGWLGSLGDCRLNHFAA